MKTATPLLTAVLASTSVLAGGMYKSGSYAVYQGLMFLVAVFLASVIFWWTYLWMVEDKGKLTRKRK